MTFTRQGSKRQHMARKHQNNMGPPLSAAKFDMAKALSLEHIQIPQTNVYASSGVVHETNHFQTNVIGPYKEVRI